MYDFLLLAPHATASHSLINYLNQHPHLYVAPSYSVDIADMGYHEQIFRPWIKVVGLSSKHYFRPGFAPAMLKATSRKLIIQAVRDPVESFASSYRANQLGNRLYKLMGIPSSPLIIEEVMAKAINEYITHAAAEDAYEARSFTHHVLIDVAELKGTGSESVISQLWKMLVGDADVPNPAFKPLGSSPFHMVRTVLNFDVETAAGNMPLSFRFEGDLSVGSLSKMEGVYAGYEVRLHAFDAAEVVPNCGVTGPLHLCTRPAPWSGLHPAIRTPFITQLVPHAEKLLREFNAAYGEAKAAATFSLDDLSAAQKDTLKRGIESDFTTFYQRHPALAAKWKTTQDFLGS